MVSRPAGVTQCYLWEGRLVGSRAGLAVLARDVGQLFSPSGELGTLTFGAGANVHAVAATSVQIRPVDGWEVAGGWDARYAHSFYLPVGRLEPQPYLLVDTNVKRSSGELRRRDRAAGSAFRAPDLTTTTRPTF